MPRFLTIALVALLTTLSSFFFAACSGDSNNNPVNTGSGGTGTAAGGGAGQGGDIFTTSGSGGSMGVGGGCATESQEATLVKKPVDIIFVIDNSGSMGQEILGVQDNINANFATIIENSGIDYRVIMLTQHGEAIGPESVCIEAPLSGIPVGGCTPAPAQPVDNPPKFYHYSHQVSSHDSWCAVLNQFDQPDEFNNHPMGWGSLLRDDSFKVFVEVTDDGVSCGPYNDGNNINNGQAAAAQFDADLLALSPAHFGTDVERNYRWYSLIALENFDPNDPSIPWQPTDPLTTGECPTAADPGTGYQALSVLTGGLRFPLCEPQFYDTVFNEIAQGVIAGAQVACNFEIPTPSNGEQVDLNSVTVQYTPGAGGSPIDLTQVPTAADCVDDAFYIDETAGEIILCADTCTTVQGDENAKIDIVFQCIGMVQ